MKAVIMSDSHRNFQSIIDIIARESDADLLIHAGDVLRDTDDIQTAYPQYPLAYVAGNNDYFLGTAPMRRVFEFGGKKIFLVHGHEYGVKSSLLRLKRQAQEVQADICIFGHTHRSLAEEQDGILFINPGSTYNSYAVLTIQNGTAEVAIKQRRE